MHQRALAPVLLALALWLAAGSGGRAATLGVARVGFNAERILVINGRHYVGKIWQMPGAQRHEQHLRALKPVLILHADSAVADILLPQLHTVAEIALPKSLSLLDSRNLPRHPIGRQRIDGIATTEYAIDRQNREGHVTGRVWLSRHGILMRCDGTFRAKDGKVTTIYWELRHVRIGPQPAALFAVPAGYTRLPIEATAPLFGLRLAKPSAR